LSAWPRAALLAIGLLAGCHITVPGSVHGIHQLERTLDLEVESGSGHLEITNRGDAELTLVMEASEVPLPAGAVFRHEFEGSSGQLQLRNASGGPVTVAYDVFCVARSPRIRVVGR
jgi:hypothetical protein